MRSSLACGPARYAPFFTIESCVPFCQLWNLNGPVKDLPFTWILAMSSQPSRDVMSQFGFMMVRYVAMKSAPVICRPSLHRAVGLYVAVAFSGSFWSSFGKLVSRYG